ncbi:T9SS type A sorting domain-containing protein [candidate division KSB1 bacterium]|nr:T9SS type A sorting domain-containing protein [candidate division KSB1 bacterium]
MVSSNSGGDQLTRYNSQLNVFLNDIEFLDTVSGITVGNGVILYTSNAGASWNPAEYDSINVPNLVCCQIIAPDFSIALSSDGQLLHSADLGKHWTYRKTIGEGNFTSITFADKENGWATNSSGSIFSSDNTGYKWEEEFSIDNGLFSLTRNESQIFACGLGGMVLTTCIDTNLEELRYDEPQQPQDFVLYQNYPNPFNSATNIVYQLKREQHISLALYNTVGQKIAILVNEFKSPGRHIHHLNFKNRSSGIYYVKMHAGDFVSTKRLVHIK